MFFTFLDSRYILLCGSSGFYSYATFHHVFFAAPVELIGNYLSYQFRGEGFTMKIENNNWRKTFGPHFIHINSVSEGEDPYALWGKAKVQFREEVHKWPYSFVESSFYAKSDHRGSLTGRFLINDNNSIPAPAPFARVGLALSGESNWQMETKGYQFWTEANPNGSFTITSITEGNYTLCGWVPGYIGEYQLDRIKIAPGGLHQSIGEVVFSPPRTGPTIWEIGIPDRSAAEFFIPDPNPNYTNQVFLHDEVNKFRQYGLWDRYTDRYPNQDIVFVIGASDYKTDWFFAHVPRRMIDGTYQKTTWQVAFSLASVPEEGEIYTLWLALASANNADLQVRINNPDTNSEPIFSTGIIGDDLAIAGHQIHGMYRLIEANMPGSLFQVGHNTIFLTQAMAESPFCGLMYDYIRLEGPDKSLNKKIPKGKKKHH